MGRFITAKARIEQTENGYWKTLDNELYLDDDSSLYLVPRYFWSDGYTFPRLIMLFLGDKHYYDIRPAHFHDIFCRFHQRIRVGLSLSQLKQKELLRIHQGKEPMVICEDIPIEYLYIEKINKKWADDCFYRTLLSADISKTKSIIMRIGVSFNLNWVNTGKKSILSFDIYNDDIGLVNGF